MPTKRKLIGGALSFRTSTVTPGGFVQNKSYEKSRRFHLNHAEIVAAAQAALRRKTQSVRVT